jgi:hypothetical protein
VDQQCCKYHTGRFFNEPVFRIVTVELRDSSTYLLLRHTVICLGKASAAVHHGLFSANMAAETDYAMALCISNKALNDVVRAKANQTRMKVMLLGIYEVKLALDIYLTLLDTHMCTFPNGDSLFSTEECYLPVLCLCN